MQAWIIKLTTESALRFLRKLWMVAVLEVPESPTKSTGLFIFTICSRIQLALVVSIVGTKATIRECMNQSGRSTLGKPKRFKPAHQVRAQDILFVQASHLTGLIFTENISKLHFRVMDIFGDQRIPGDPLFLCTIKMEIIQSREVSCMDQDILLSTIR